MAAAVAAAVYLFLLTFSSAQLLFDHQHNDFFSADPSLVALSDSDPKPGAALLLPSERPGNEHATFVEVEPEEIGSKSRRKEQDEGKSVSISESQSESFPLTTVITLRPINRQFSRVPSLPVRRGFKCHGRRRNHIHQIKQRFAGQGKISFGNDMILAKDRDLGFDPSYTGEVQRMERWGKYDHGGDRIRVSNDDAMREEMYGLYHARPHFHNHHRRHPHEEEEEERHNHESENGIINGIRRFFKF